MQVNSIPLALHIKTFLEFCGRSRWLTRVNPRFFAFRVVQNPLFNNEVSQ